MICVNCAEAGDIVKAQRLLVDDKGKMVKPSARLETIVNDLHLLCTPNICDCQHKIDWEGKTHAQR